MNKFEQFYQAYPRKVGKGAAIKAFDKLKPDDKLLKKMLLAIQAQVRYRYAAKRTGEFIADWPHPGTWINGIRWEDEIPSHSELKERKIGNKCAEPGCTSEVHGPKFNKCTHHVSRMYG